VSLRAWRNAISNLPPSLHGPSGAAPIKPPHKRPTSSRNCNCSASPIYTAIYEIDHPQVLESPEWAEAVGRGRWPSEVRPHTSNRQHLLFKVQ